MIVPSFRAKTHQLGSFEYHDLVDGTWAVLVFLGDSYDPVATTELGHLCKLREEFEKRNVRLMCVLPTLEQGWLNEVEELEDCLINMPLIVDTDRKISDAMRIRRGNTAYFVIDIDKRVRLSLSANARTGRNFYELLRSIDALQLAFFHQVATPANWSSGQDLLIPSHISDRSAQALYPNAAEQHPLLRYRTTKPFSHL